MVVVLVQRPDLRQRRPGPAEQPGRAWIRRIQAPDEGGKLLDENGEPTFQQGDDEDDPSVQEFKARKMPYENPQTQDTFQKVPVTP